MIHIKEFKEHLNDNFYKWFGKSKMVDDKGNPRIFYHGVGSGGKFSSFKKELIGATSGNRGHYGEGFYFSNSEKGANTFSKTYGGTGEVMEVYLKIENPFKVTRNSLIELGEKYKLNLPEKEPVSIDLDSVSEQLKTIDPVSSELFELIRFNGYEKGWEIFIEKYNNDIPTSKLDLNDITELIEYGVIDYYSSLPHWIMDYIDEVGFKDVIIYDYNEDIRMDYLTNLGQNPDEWTNAIKKEGYDGVDAGDEILVFEPTQIKSIHNNGTFSPNSDNINESNTFNELVNVKKMGI